MPYSKDIRCGEGWFTTNVNCFYEYLTDRDEEIVIRTSYKSPLKDDPEPIYFSELEKQYHNTALEEEIEIRTNEYISWRVFGTIRKQLDEEDYLPDFFEDNIWGYVYHHICLFVRNHKTWYDHRDTNNSESE